MLTAFKCNWESITFTNTKELNAQWKNNIANVNRKIADKLRYLSINSKQRHLFLDIFESCCNHRQMSVKIKIKSHIEQKNWENFGSMKKVCKNNKKFFVDMIENIYFSVDLAFGAK